MSENGFLYAIEQRPWITLFDWRPRYAIFAVIGACSCVTACSFSHSTFEAVCPTTLPRMNGHMAGLPAEWFVVTGAFPAHLQTLAVGDKIAGSARGDREDLFPNGDVLITWSIEHDYSPYVICSYRYTPVWFALKIPDNMASCQYLSHHDEKARDVEPLKCSASP